MRGGMRRKRAQEPVELNVTAFMNLMVVLVPFLLLSAVFSQITVHDLNLPALSDAPPAKEQTPRLVLEVVIRKNSLEVMDRNTGRIKLIENAGDVYDFAALNAKLQEVKQSFPDISAVTLLLEPEVAYDHLIATMDAVRVAPDPSKGKDGKRELFPDISIGDAPKAREGA